MATPGDDFSTELKKLHRFVESKWNLVPRPSPPLKAQVERIQIRHDKDVYQRDKAIEELEDQLSQRGNTIRELKEREDDLKSQVMRLTKEKNDLEQGLRVNTLKRKISKLKANLKKMKKTAKQHSSGGTNNQSSRKIANKRSDSDDDEYIDENESDDDEEYEEDSDGCNDLEDYLHAPLTGQGIMKEENTTDDEDAGPVVPPRAKKRKLSVTMDSSLMSSKTRSPKSRKR